MKFNKQFNQRSRKLYGAFNPRLPNDEAAKLICNDAAPTDKCITLCGCRPVLVISL